MYGSLTKNGYIIHVIMDECTTEGYMLPTQRDKRTKYHAMTSQFATMFESREDAAIIM